MIITLLSHYFCFLLFVGVRFERVSVKNKDFVNFRPPVGSLK